MTGSLVDFSLLVPVVSVRRFSLSNLSKIVVRHHCFLVGFPTQHYYFLQAADVRKLDLALNQTRRSLEILTEPRVG
jgi:hypothetical protein